MALGEFTRQLAKEAIGNQVKDVIDSLRPANLGQISDSIAGNKPAPPAAGESAAQVILGQIGAMQKALKEDEELVLLCDSGVEILRVLEIFVPSWNVAVLTGIDTQRVVTRVIQPADGLRLICKVMKIAPGSKATAVRIIAPKSA